MPTHEAYFPVRDIGLNRVASVLSNALLHVQVRSELSFFA